MSTSSRCISNADIDECKVENGGCHPKRKCINIPGSSRCGDCPSGMLKDGFTGCRGINLQCPASVRSGKGGYWSDSTKWVQGQVPTVCARLVLFVATDDACICSAEVRISIDTSNLYTMPHSYFDFSCRSRISFCSPNKMFQ